MRVITHMQVAAAWSWCKPAKQEARQFSDVVNVASRLSLRRLRSLPPRQDGSHCRTDRVRGRPERRPDLVQDGRLREQQHGGSAA